ncbi:SLBB domain-containing protein [Haloferula sargassicola]|uniref:Uncharacterized protein n=1 Tax=Haloferula sargassicola TaxID=490096 RepID=A0ABP9UQQ5_9BACT
MNRLSSFFAFFALSVAFLSSVGTAQNAVPVLKADDVVRLEVFGEEDLTTVTKVMKSGEAVFPLIGAVDVAGVTLEDTIEKVRKLYDAKYLVDPKVRITVEEYATQFFSVIGAVNAPGQFPMPPAGRIDLSAALATAGGLAENADKNRIMLTRAGGGSTTYSRAQAENSSAIQVRPGDRVVVSQSAYVGKTITVLGQVRKPGPQPLPVDGRLDVVSAIAQAGGFTELANPKKVSVNRRGRVTTLNLREMTETGKDRYYLEPDDIITVAERFF